MDTHLQHSSDPLPPERGPVGKYLGPYQVEAELGRGAMGVVFQVRRGGGGPPLALKLLLPEVLHDEVGAERFLIEAQTMSHLGDHPGIVAVIDFDRTAQGMPYYVMEYVEGHTLRQASRELSERPRLELIQQVARALEHAHSEGFVHRDVKPDNVMVTPDGQAKLTDFGIAHVLGGNQALTRTGDILGTPVYMAPELAAPGLGEVGPPCDVFSLGAMVYEVLTGQTPYTGKTAVGIFTKLLEGHEIPSLRSQRPHLRPELEELVERSLARAPGDRQPNAGILADELELALASGPIDVPPRSSATWVGALVAVLIVVALGLAGYKVLSRPPETVVTLSPEATLLAEGKAVELLQQLATGTQWSSEGYLQLSAPDRARLAAWVGAPKEAEAALSAIEPDARQLALRWELRPYTGATPETPTQLSAAIGTSWAGLAQGEEALGRGFSGLAAVCFARVAGEETDPDLVLSARLGEARAHLALGDLASADAALVAAASSKLAEAGPTLARVRWQMVGRRVLVSATPEQGQSLSGAVDRDLVFPAPVTQGDRIRAFLAGTESNDQSSARELTACASGLDGAEGLLLARACRLALAAEQGNHVASAEKAIALLEGVVQRQRPKSPSVWIALARAHMVLHNSRKADLCAKEALLIAPRDPLTLIAVADTRAAVTAYMLDHDYGTDEARPDDLQQAPRRMTKVISGYQRLYPKLDPTLNRQLRVRTARVILEQARLKEFSTQDAPPTPTEAIEIRKRLRERLREELLPILRARAGKIDANEVSGLRRQLAYYLAKQDHTRAARKTEELARLGAKVTFEQLEALRLRVGAGDQSSPQHAEAYLALAGDVPAEGLLRVRRLEIAPRDQVAKRALRTWVAIDRPLMLPYVRLRGVELAGERGKTTSSLTSLARVVLDGPELTLHVLSLLARGEAPPMPAAKPGDGVRHLARALASRAARIGFVRGVEDAPRLSQEQARAALLDADAAVASFPDRAGAYLVRAWIRLAAGPDVPSIRARALHDLEIARAAAPWAWPALLLMRQLESSPSSTLAEELLTWGLVERARDERESKLQPLLLYAEPKAVPRALESLSGQTLRLVVRTHLMQVHGFVGREPSAKSLASVAPGWRNAALTALRRRQGDQAVRKDPRHAENARNLVLSVGVVGLQRSSPMGQSLRLTRPALLGAGQMPIDSSERLRTGAPSHPDLWRAAFWLHTGTGVLGELAQGDAIFLRRLEGLRWPRSLSEKWSYNTAMLYAAQDSYTAWVWAWLMSRGPSETKSGHRNPKRMQELILAANRYVAFSRGASLDEAFYRMLQFGLRAYVFMIKDQGRIELVQAYTDNTVRLVTGSSPLTQAVHLDLTLDLFAWLQQNNAGPNQLDPLRRKVARALADIPPIENRPLDPELHQWWRRFRANVVVGNGKEARAILTRIGGRLRDPRIDYGPRLGGFVLNDPLVPVILKHFPNLQRYLRPQR